MHRSGTIDWLKMTLEDIGQSLGCNFELIDSEPKIEEEIQYIPDNDYNPTSHDGGWID